jgi:hypothetical protein
MQTSLGPPPTNPGPVSRTVGPNLTLQEFCNQFDVTANVYNKLVNKGYTNSQVLQYVAIDELKEMGFKFGEIALLKDAVARWSLPLT